MVCGHGGADCCRGGEVSVVEFLVQASILFVQGVLCFTWGRERTLRQIVEDGGFTEDGVTFVVRPAKVEEVKE